MGLNQGIDQTQRLVGATILKGKKNVEGWGGEGKTESGEL